LHSQRGRPSPPEANTDAKGDNTCSFENVFEDESDSDRSDKYESNDENPQSRQTSNITLLFNMGNNRFGQGLHEAGEPLDPKTTRRNMLMSEQEQSKNPDWPYYIKLSIDLVKERSANMPGY
jgi:hypothetical protein